MSKDGKTAGGGIAQTDAKEDMKKGGRTKRKSGGKVPGKMPGMRLDKKGRSPLSGANAPNLGYASPKAKIDQGGKGKTV